MAAEPLTIDSETGEVIDAQPSRALRVIDPGIVRQMVTAAEAKAEWDAYIALCAAILSAADYQKIGAKQFKKKSAWRKLAKAFDVSDRLLDHEVLRDTRGWPVYATCTVEAEHKRTGRTGIGYHEAHLGERCCPAKDGGRCKHAAWDSHTCCATGCDGWLHWSHPGDIPATAHTRAKNRAIADLIGAGEVSAEEMSELGNAPQHRQPAAPRPSAPRKASPPKPTAPTEPAGDNDQRTLYATANEIWPGQDAHLNICRALNLPNSEEGAMHAHWFTHGGTWKQATLYIAEVRRVQLKDNLRLDEAALRVDAYKKLTGKFGE